MSRCPEKMKLNAFRNVCVPTVRQLYSRFGERTSLTGFSTSLADALEAEPVPLNESKLTQVQRAKAYCMSRVADDSE